MTSVDADAVHDRLTPVASSTPVGAPGAVGAVASGVTGSTFVMRYTLSWKSQFVAPMPHWLTELM